jgi:CheY-like chemotaxis protein
MSTVLVIEDNEDNLKLVTYTLGRAGYSVVPAKSGEDGLSVALEESPAFILMDINLPGIDGIETTRRFRKREHFRTVPIIAVTSFAMIGDRERILAAGCSGYIEKPIDPVTFVAQIEAIVRAEV